MSVNLFSLNNVGQSPAKFDLEKLRATNAYYFQKITDEKVCDLILSHVSPTSPLAKERVKTLLPQFRERAKTHLDIIPQIKFLLSDGAPILQEEAALLLTKEAKIKLIEFSEYIAGNNWNKNSLNTTVQEFLGHNKLKMRDIGPPLRAALTGLRETPSIIDIMEALGEVETIARLNAACK